MTGLTIITCGRCDEPIEFPTPNDGTLIADVIAAHGATHGEDWREWGLTVMSALISQAEDEISGEGYARG